MHRFTRHDKTVMEVSPYPLSSRRSVAQWRDLLFCSSTIRLLMEALILPFVIPSEAEGSAVHPSDLPNFPYQTLTLKQNCHPDRSVAKWRDLLLCHPLSDS